MVPIKGLLLKAKYTQCNGNNKDLIIAGAQVS